MSKTLVIPDKRTTSLSSIPGWNELQPEEKELVRNESQSLSEQLYFERKCRAAVGKHLVTLREVLEPKKLWGAFLHNGFGMSKSTAYNYINEYQIITEKLTNAFIEVAMKGGYNLRLEAIERTPPPKTEDPKEIIAYLEKLDRPKPRLVPPPLDPPDELLKDCVHYVTVRWNRLPTRGRTRERFKTDFIGMILKKFGATRSESFSPISGPQTITPRKAGRPRKKVA